MQGENEKFFLTFQFLLYTFVTIYTSPAPKI